MRHTTRAVLVFAALFGLAGRGFAAESVSKEDRDAQVRAEITAQTTRLLKESRNGDTEIFAQMIAPDYAEFNPWFPFLVDPPKAVSVAMEKAWDLYDKQPKTDRAHKIEKIQVYGDAALVTFTSVAKGAPVGGGFMTQAKFLSVYVKMNGIWVLVATHDGRRVGPDGIPID